MTQTAGVIGGGDFSQRVVVSGSDEIGELAKTFNHMARSLEDRSQALIDLNKRLEEKVRERTSELEQSNQQLQKAYEDLKETQVQLVQSEKMASLDSWSPASRTRSRTRSTSFTEHGFP